MTYCQYFGKTFFLILSLGLIWGVSSNVQEREVHHVQDRAVHVPEFIESLITTLENAIDNGLKESCAHDGEVWECCLEITGKLNITCISIEYLPDEIGLELNITVGGLLIINRRVSVRNPPPICAAVPYFEKIANVCFTFHDLEEKDKVLNGCVRIEGHVEGFNVFKVELGCFKIPLLFGKKSVTHFEDNYIVNMMQVH